MSLCSLKNPNIHNKKRKEKTLPGSIDAIPCVGARGSHIYKGTPRHSCLNGAFTLEAAVILPLLAVFFVSILFFFRVMQVELQVQKALDDTGRKLAVCLCGEGTSDMAGRAMAKALFLKEMAGREEADSYITGGSVGIILAGSSFEGDKIHLSADYHIALPIRLFWRWDLHMVQYANCRKWSGWRAGGGTGEVRQWVYITDTGTVYHVTDRCTHLVLSIRSVNIGQVEALRSENGERYRRCTRCTPRKLASGQVYITNQGNHYHSDLNCSGIKRTVFMVRLSEVKGRRACSRCSVQEG